MSSEVVAQFRSGLERHQDVWRAIRLRGIAVRSDRATWLVARVLISLEREKTAKPVIVGTRNGLAFDTSIDIKKLRQLLVGLSRGQLPKELIGWSRPMLHLGEEGCMVSYSEGEASRIRWGESDGALSRFELEFRRNRDSSSPPFIPYPLGVLCDKEFKDAGLGSAATVCGRLRLHGNGHGVFQDDNVARVVAAVPARICRIQQSADRTRLSLEIEAHSALLSRLTVVAEPRQGGLKRPKRHGVNGSIVTVPINGPGPIHITLLLDGRAIQTEEVTPLPRTRASVRFVAQSAYLDQQALLRDGLLPSSARNSEWFERSVAHLFTALGMSAFWWGRKEKGADPRFPMPGEVADALAFSANDAVVALVECTVDTLGKEKAHKLLQRATRIGRVLRRELGDHSPRVVPVLTASVPMDELPRTVREMLVEEGGVILDREQLENLLNLVEAGASDDEIQEALPAALRSDEAARRLLPIF